MSFSILEIILSVFFAALLVTVIFRQLHLPVILGYLIVGALVGPHAFKLVPDSQYIKDLAEFGIVLLMFTVGLEFSLPKLFALRFPVIVIGGSQVILTILISALIGQWLGMTSLTAIVVGCIIAMSSTAIALKQLQDQLELYTPHGLNAIGVLLFQDLAVIPIIILIPSLAGGNIQHSLTYILLWALLKGVVAILLIFTVGRWLLRPLFHLISRTRAVELFTLGVLMVTLTSAWLTHTLGLSFALGAFLAGIMLAETEFRHQIEIEIRPFRDILLGLFFITIGMLTDVSTWHLTWIWIVLMLVALIPGKMLLVALVSRLAGSDTKTAVRSGLVLAQGSEFGFAILTLALSHDLFPADYGQVILAALLLSIAIAPVIIYFNKRIASVLVPQSRREKAKLVKLEAENTPKELKHHVIICGFGRVGQHLAYILDKMQFPFVGIDIDAQLVRYATLAGTPMLYGDPAHPEILHAAGIDHARVLVISFNDLNSTLKILSMVKHSHPQLPILVRCRDNTELRALKEYGPAEIIAELFEASITMSDHLLNLLNIAPNKITELLADLRNKDYDILQKIFPSSYEKSGLSSESQGLLTPIIIPAGALGVDRKIQDLNLAILGIEVVAIRRGQEKIVKPRGNLKLKANDIIILYGTRYNIEKAEKIILQGE